MNIHDDFNRCFFADFRAMRLAFELWWFVGLFQRSLGDEFGNAIRGDIPKLTGSYGVIIVTWAKADWDF